MIRLLTMKSIYWINKSILGSADNNDASVFMSFWPACQNVHKELRCHINIILTRNLTSV